MNMQKLILLGRAVKDAEVITAKSGKEFATFSLAVNRFMGKDKEAEPTYYDCVVFGDKIAKIVGERVKKGDLVTVEGRPEAEAYISKEGEAKGRIKVIADDWQVLK